MLLTQYLLLSAALFFVLQELYNTTQYHKYNILLFIVVTVFLVQWLAMKLHTQESQVQLSLIHKSMYAIFFFNAVFNVSSFTFNVLNKYCTLQHCSVLYWIGLFCTKEQCLYCIVVYCTIKSYTVLYFTIINCTVLHCNLLYRTVLEFTMKHCTVLYLN